jgi:hypothetical protein
MEKSSGSGKQQTIRITTIRGVSYCISNKTTHYKKSACAITLNDVESCVDEIV